MSAILFLVGLLVLSYLGSFLVTGRSVGGLGLPSGVEYVALGFVLGPQALGLVGRDMLAAFEPVVQVALGWLAFAVGLDFGFRQDRRVGTGSLLLAAASALLTGGAVAAATWVVASRLHVGASPRERILVAGGVGAACSETTRHAVRWVIDRLDAHGPLARRLDEIAHSDDLLPLVAVAVLFALRPTPHVALPIPLLGWPAATAGLGLLLGGGAALLVRGDLELEETWAVLFGATLIAVGVAARLGLATLTVSFFLGLAMAALSGQGPGLRRMVAPTERPVLLPALLLAGAHLDLRASAKLAAIATAAIGARFVSKIVVGWLIARSSAHARKTGPLVGLSLMSSGALAISIGLAFALRFPGWLGDTVLAVATLSALLGEFVGPARLRRSLQAAGEIGASA